MTSQDHDTDPSTPGAKRLSEPRTPVAASFGVLEGGASTAGRVKSGNTDPGIAPPGQRALSVPKNPIGVVVPPVGVRPNDSIDILLEGIAREQPDRPRTTPQTDGQAAAAYHARHAVHPSHTSPNGEPTVVLDRYSAEARRFEQATGSDDDARPWGEITAASPQPLVGRIVVAVVAGLAVVAAIFVALQRDAVERLIPHALWPAGAVSRSDATDPKWSAARPTTEGAAAMAPAPLASKPVPVVQPAPPAESAGAGDVGEGEAAAAGSATRKPVVAASKAKPKSAKATVSGAHARPTDLGEFKTTF